MESYSVRRRIYARYDGVFDHHGSLRRSKGPVAAHSGTRTVRSHDSEMISSMGSQAADAGSNIPVRVASLTLHGCGVAVTGRRAPLERNSCHQPMWIERAIQCRRRTGDVSCRASRHNGGAGRGKCGKGLVAAHTSARTVTRYDSEMISCACTQATDAGANVQVRVPTATQGRSREAVARRGAILEVNTRS